jgi:hypothetical protein
VKKSFLIALFVCGFASAAPIVPTRADYNFKVELKLVSPQEAFNYCKKEGMWPQLTVRPLAQALGCASFYFDEKRCVIVTPVPLQDGDDAMLNLGHEVLHCALGIYHK